jgi:uncharacterized membrane protein YkvA (DUF1232 family)
MDLAAWLIAVLATMVVVWVGLVVLLWLNRPSRELAITAVRLVPEVLGLARRVLADPSTPRGAKAALIFLVAWLAMPFDLVPDFLPVIGQLDDLIVVVVVLRWVGRRIGHDRLLALWTGSDDGWRLLTRLLGWSAS